MAPIILLVSRRVHRLEYDPVTQFKFNFFFTWLWFISIFTIPFLPVLYNHSLGFLITEELSIWALFISHFTALGSAIAGIFSSNRQEEIPGLNKVYKTRQKTAPVFDETQADAQVEF